MQVGRKCLCDSVYQPLVQSSTRYTTGIGVIVWTDVLRNWHQLSESPVTCSVPRTPVGRMWCIYACVLHVHSCSTHYRLSQQYVLLRSRFYLNLYIATLMQVQELLLGRDSLTGAAGMSTGGNCVVLPPVDRAELENR